MKGRSRPPKTFTDKMRNAVIKADMTRYAICKATGIHESALSRFVNGRSGLSLESLDLLAELLGWELVINETSQRANPME